MDKILEMMARGFEQLIGRASGPLNFRLIVMPTVVTILAIRAGLRDAREGQPAIWGHSYQRRPPAAAYPLRAKRRWQDIHRCSRSFSVYQLFVMREFHVPQLLFVAVACAIVPYVLIRVPITHLARGWYSKQTRPANKPVAKTTRDTIQKRVS